MFSPDFRDFLLPQDAEIKRWVKNGGKMKIGKILILCAFVVAPGGADAIAIQVCMSNADCMKNCVSGRYCCPTGENGTKKTCPTGWSLNLAQTLCTRSATSGLSDSRGYYNQNYGTCSPTSNTFPCFAPSLKPTAGMMQCMTCIGI